MKRLWFFATLHVLEGLVPLQLGTGLGDGACAAAGYFDPATTSECSTAGTTLGIAICATLQLSLIHI